MSSPAGTMTPVSSMCDTPTPALSPGDEGVEEEGGFLTCRVTPAVINDHLRCPPHRYILVHRPTQHALHHHTVLR